MSALLGAFPEYGSPPPSDAALSPALDALRVRGRDREELHREDAALLGVLRHDWELAPWISGNVLLARDQESGVVVAADAALYYRDDLLRAMGQAGIRSRGSNPAELILAAYLAWGDSCPDATRG